MFRELNVIEGMMAQHVGDKSEFFGKLYDKIFEFRRSLEFEDKKPVDTVASEERQEEEMLTQDPVVNKLIADFKRLKESGDYDRINEELGTHIQELVDDQETPWYGYSLDDLTWKYSDSSKSDKDTPPENPHIR